jgi:protein-tyrosine-phosphatase
MGSLSFTGSLYIEFVPIATGDCGNGEITTSYGAATTWTLTSATSDVPSIPFDSTMFDDERVTGSVLFLCTGNAARSVMGGVALEACRADLAIDTAGTLTVDGLPISWRTRAALDSVGLAWPKHRSKQAHRIHLDAADLVVAMAPEHVEWVRRNHPHAAVRTATMKYLVASLASDERSLRERIASLNLERRTLDAGEEIIDPGGGEVEAFIACAHEIVTLVRDLATKL